MGEAVSMQHVACPPSGWRDLDPVTLSSLGIGRPAPPMPGLHVIHESQSIRCFFEQSGRAWRVFGQRTGDGFDTHRPGGRNHGVLP